ncbi:ribosome modulation factor [Escherichia coli]|nr:ribosome modulation factor [Escherichia coli]MBW6087881.1 ribosome modulation factor [Escherichia coli]MBW6099603.1 ribosome modulation factor [Escherichia coli]
MRETRHEETKNEIALERAHQRGYQAGIAGRSKEMCPYQTLNQRSQWLGGWREAMADRVVMA